MNHKREKGMGYDVPAVCGFRGTDHAEVPTMITLTAFVLTTSTFLQLLRFGQQRGASLSIIVAVNYTVAFGLTLAWGLTRLDTGTDHTTTLVAMGLVNGSLYFLHLLVTLAAFRLVGVGITTALCMTASVTPAFVAWAAWGEAISTPQWAGLAMLPAAVFLMRPVSPPVAVRTFATLKVDLVLLLAFGMAAVVSTMHKAADVFGRGGDQPLYNMTLFATAAISSVAYAVWRRRRVTRFEMSMGVAIGTVNCVNLLLLLLSLSQLPTAIVFPVSSCLLIIVNLVASRFLWGEALRRRQLLGVGVAIVVVILCNISG